MAGDLGFQVSAVLIVSGWLARSCVQTVSRARSVSGPSGRARPAWEKSARRRLDPDAPGRPAEGSLRAARRTVEALAAERGERNEHDSWPPPLPAPAFQPF